MISMSACGCGGNPVFGAIVSSFHTLSEPQPMRSGSWYSANEKWCLASSQPWLAPPRLSKGLRSIILLLRFIEARVVSAMSPRSDVSGPLKEETIETHRFQYGSSGSRSPAVRPLCRWHRLHVNAIQPQHADLGRRA